MTALKDMLESLINCPSITPHDAGCQDIIASYLSALGFTVQRLDNHPVSNLYARFGSTNPILLLAGHTDVVPAGDISLWHSDPFTLYEKDGLVYARGVADMKGSIASMLLMAKRFVEKNPSPKASLAFLITSGEEGDQFDLGTPYVMSELAKCNELPQYCIVGEPSSTNSIADVVKIGRRGSLSATLILQGKQGHVAYPHLAQNPIHLISPVLTELSQTIWDKGNAHFPATSFQITEINAGGTASNIIPGTIKVQFNFRYSTAQTADTLKAQVEMCFAKYKLSPDIKWQLNGVPFLTEHGHLNTAVNQAVLAHTGKTPEYSTSGGTSDGRFIAPYGIEVIELGPVNASIHQINECTRLSDLDRLSDIYLMIAEILLS